MATKFSRKRAGPDLEVFRIAQREEESFSNNMLELSHSLPQPKATDGKQRNEN